MPSSSELRKKAAAEDNDIKAFGILTKVVREERSERWFSKWYDIFREHYTVIERDNGSFSIEVYEGTIDYYPKANKCLVRWKNKWKKPGLRWLIKNYMDE